MAEKKNGGKPGVAARMLRSLLSASTAAVRDSLYADSLCVILFFFFGFVLMNSVFSLNCLKDSLRVA